jgi:hypothetical protein
MLWSTQCHAVVKHPHAVVNDAAGSSRRHAATVAYAQAGTRTAHIETAAAQTVAAASAGEAATKARLGASFVPCMAFLWTVPHASLKPGRVINAVHAVHGT